jgi:hypothetical protein
VVIVTEKIPLRAKQEAENAFLLLLREETTRDLFKQILDIHVIALFPNRKISLKARYRHLKERLLNVLNEVRNNKEDN